MTESEAPRRRRLRRLARRASVIVAAVVAALTVASFSYNLATGPAPRPPGLRMLSAGGFDTRYRTWGTSGSPVVLVPGAFETADTFDALATALGTDHRVFAIDLTGTGYSTPSPPFTASHLADQLIAFMATERLTGANAPVIVGHSSGAAVVGMAALRGRNIVAGVMFLDGDAIGLVGAPSLLGWLLVNPYRTTILRLGLSSSWLIRTIYNTRCGPLQQPGYESAAAYTIRHGIPSMTTAEFSQLRADAVPKRVVSGIHDSQISAADAAETASRIGAPPPTAVPGRHLTMISSPQQVAAAIRAFIRSTGHP